MVSSKKDLSAHNINRSMPQVRACLMHKINGLSVDTAFCTPYDVGPRSPMMKEFYVIGTFFGLDLWALKLLTYFELIVTRLIEGND